MTVKELIDVMPFCEDVNVIVRQDGSGKWIQGYRVGLNAQLHPSEIWPAELCQNFGCTYTLQAGEEFDAHVSTGMPVKVMHGDVHRLPKNVGNLTVCHVQPRHLLHNSFDNEFELEIWCYPDGWTPEKPADTAPEDGQMSFEF